MHWMDDRVTSRTIAYKAVQVCDELSSFHLAHRRFAPADTTYWVSLCAGFDYEGFCEFIVDYFEADTALQAQET